MGNVNFAVGDSRGDAGNAEQFFQMIADKISSGEVASLLESLSEEKRAQVFEVVDGEANLANQMTFELWLNLLEDSDKADKMASLKAIME